MRKTTENQGNRQPTLSEYFSPKNKVPLQRCSLSQPETPMKPSQLPNQLSRSPYRRPSQLPNQLSRSPYRRIVPSPGLCHSRGRLGPLHHPPQSPGPVYNSSGIVPSSPANTAIPVKRPLLSSPQFRKDISKYSSLPSIRTDSRCKPKATLPITGREYENTQRHGSSKVRSSDVGNSAHAVQRHRPSAPPSFSPRTGQDRPLPLSGVEYLSPANSRWRPNQPWHSQFSRFDQSPDRSRGPCSPTMRSPVCSPVTAHQDLKRTPSGDRLIPEGVNRLSLKKRHRESEGGDGTAKKKRCLHDSTSGPAQTPGRTAGNSPGLSLVTPPSSNHSSDMELSPKSTDGLLRREPAPVKPARLTPSPTLKATQSSCSSRTSTQGLASQPRPAVKPVYMLSPRNQVVRLKEIKSPSKTIDQSWKKDAEEKKKGDASSVLSSLKQFIVRQSGVPRKHTDHTKGEAKVGESRCSDSRTPKPVPKPNSASLSCHVMDRNRTALPRRTALKHNDIDDLFTPDPLTYVRKPENPLLTSPKMCSVRTPSVGSPPHEIQSSTVAPPPEPETKMSSPKRLSFLWQNLPKATLILERLKCEDFPGLFSPSRRELSVETGPKSSLKPKNVSPCNLEADLASSPSNGSPATPEGSLKDEGSGEQVDEEDPLDEDMELDLDLSFELDVDLRASESSDDEELLSFQEMMGVGHMAMPPPPDTPEKGAFSEPSTPGQSSCPFKPQPVQALTKPGIYYLDEMLKERNSDKRSRAVKTELLPAIEEDLLKIAEYEQAEENRDEAITTQQQEFLQRYSLMSSGIRDRPPGELIFNLDHYCRIFNQHTLELRQCIVNPQDTAQKTLLGSSPAQLRLHVVIGLFQEAWQGADCPSPCPPQVTHFLFKMMSVHTERLISEKIRQALCHIADTAACQRVQNGSRQFQVWVPTVADVTLVLMNMGVPFVTLFPFENLQPPFTEGDLLEDVHIGSESPSSYKEQTIFPEHNYNNVLKYLSHCMQLCPRAYSDDELLLLLTVVSRLGLEARLGLSTSRGPQHYIVNNIRDWSDTMLARMCVALTDLTDDHHNMCWLLQTLPDNLRGKQLRRHLSLSMISKLLDGNSTYRPTSIEFKLSALRPHLHRMQPSRLLRCMMTSSSRKKGENMASLDQQAYYLCHSLLTLANEAANFQFFPAHQKKQLLFLSSVLETHIKCDIIESEKCMYRSKVKDLVARIYTKWQVLLHRTRPLDGQLYDYWRPLREDSEQQPKKGHGEK